MFNHCIILLRHTKQFPLNIIFVFQNKQQQVVKVRLSGIQLFPHFFFNYVIYHRGAKTCNFTEVRRLFYTLQNIHQELLFNHTKTPPKNKIKMCGT